jgi:hypothetical protein
MHQLSSHARCAYDLGKCNILASAIRMLCVAAGQDLSINVGRRHGNVAVSMAGKSSTLHGAMSYRSKVVSPTMLCACSWRCQGPAHSYSAAHHSLA